MLIRCLLALCLVSWASLPVRAQSPPDRAYGQVANWLFELYLNRSIQLSVFNANQIRPGAEQVLAPQMQTMAVFLNRHRGAFVAAILPALQSHVPPTEIGRLEAVTQVQPLQLDDAARARLIEVDQEFRRDQQSVIRALTADLNVVIGDALAQAKVPQ
jgi:hypothetical protein